MKSDTLNVIVVSAAPAGRFLEGHISGTPKPGTLMQIKAATEPKNGRFTWEVFNQASDGIRGLIAILLEDDLQGKGIDDAYVDGSRCKLYCPIPGDELLVRVAAPGTGTGDSFAIGAKLMADDGTGLFVASTGAAVGSEPFVVTETAADVVSTGTLVQVMFTGY